MRNPEIDLLVSECKEVLLAECKTYNEENKDLFFVILPKMGIKA